MSCALCAPWTIDSLTNFGSIAGTSGTEPRQYYISLHRQFIVGPASQRWPNYELTMVKWSIY